MPGIVPDPISGALPVRDADGNPILQPSVENAYSPGPDFQISCSLDYLPNNCTARIAPAQINAFQSEMLCLAEAFNPAGAWDCDAGCNLSTNFKAWMTQQNGGLSEQVQMHLCGTRTEQFAAALAANPDATFMMCDGAGNALQTPAADLSGALLTDAGVSPFMRTLLDDPNAAAARQTLGVPVDEAGIWTPSLQFGGASTGITYSLASGMYRKFGDMVFLEGSLQLSNKGSATGNATILGVPFVSITGSGIGGLGGFRNFTNTNLGGVGVPYAHIGSNNNLLTLNYWPTGGGDPLNLTNVHFNNNSILNFAIWYIAGS